MTDKSNKISIRFFNDRQVRAVWDEDGNKWWFSVLDIIGVLNNEDDYTKTRNYWKYLKGKLKNENPELVSGTNQLKLLAPDGKRPTVRHSALCAPRATTSENGKQKEGGEPSFAFVG